MMQNFWKMATKVFPPLVHTSGAKTVTSKYNRAKRNQKVKCVMSL
jgi:hypothetical protein